MRERSVCPRPDQLQLMRIEDAAADFARLVHVGRVEQAAAREVDAGKAAGHGGRPSRLSRSPWRGTVPVAAGPVSRRACALAKPLPDCAKPSAGTDPIRPDGAAATCAPTRTGDTHEHRPRPRQLAHRRTWGPWPTAARVPATRCTRPPSPATAPAWTSASNHAQCSQSIIDYIVQRDLKDFVLLGHSYGGTIISKVVEAVPERVRRLVYWNAFVLNDGESLDDNVPPHYRGAVRADRRRQRRQQRDDALPDLARGLHQRRRPGHRQRTYALLSPEPYQPFIDKLDLKKFATLQTPRSYINCTEDIALPPGPEWGWHPRMSSRLGLFRLVQIPGSHEVMFTAPQRLAGAIVDAGRD